MFAMHKVYPRSCIEFVQYDKSDSVWHSDKLPTAVIHGNQCTILFIYLPIYLFIVTCKSQKKTVLNKLDQLPSPQ